MPTGAGCCSGSPRAPIVANVVVAVSPSVLPMVAGRLLPGVTIGGVWVLLASLAMRLVPRSHLGKALSIIFGGSSIAAVVAAPLGSFRSGLRRHLG